MHTVTTKSTDDLVLNAEIGKLLGDQGQIHVFSGANGYKVRVLKDGQWKIVNWRSPDIAAALKEKFGIEVWKDDSGNFRAKSPNARVSAVADNSRLALALAALKAPTGSMPAGLSFA